ncbi:hypothetical protein J2T60_000197 [Natronospira proteinivora]|uniref:Uncharacterized protein n=1 Tax=Natronospira proteinivora TaxID=1807133 RepID=A0ABT1G8E0_9GAMM|nr:hypothetical protein [Natronospira proteinivora]MCP1726232.1 hypothetical protein [Natronospira proteinivora]
MANDPQAQSDELKLASEEYRLVVAPALAAAAETAAERGDPQLFNDMASMLALCWMVEGLVAAYQREVDREQWVSEAPAMDAAPLGACALVFTESDLEADQVNECIGALAQASRLLKEDGVDKAGREALTAAWRALRVDAYEQAIDRLQGCARAMAVAVDEWEQHR